MVDDLFHLQLARCFLRLLPALVIRPRGLKPGGSARRLARGTRGKARQHVGRACGDCQIRPVPTAEFRWIGMDVNEALARCRHVDKRVSAGSDLAEPCAEYQQKISLLHPAGEGRVYADPDIARITGVAVVDVVLAAERGSDGKIVRLGE